MESLKKKGTISNWLLTGMKANRNKEVKEPVSATIPGIKNLDM